MKIHSSCKHIPAVGWVPGYRSLPPCELSPVAARILGCSLEKQRTTPDQYPLSLNSLVAACNQTTNRWPVVRYDAETVEAGLDELRERQLVRREKPHGGRAIKYSHSLPSVVPLAEPGLAVLAVLLLRGPQTPGELKAPLRTTPRVRRPRRARHHARPTRAITKTVRWSCSFHAIPVTRRRGGRTSSRSARRESTTGEAPGSGGVPDVADVTVSPTGVSPTRVTRSEGEVSQLSGPTRRARCGTRALASAHRVGTRDLPQPRRARSRGVPCRSPPSGDSIRRHRVSEGAARSSTLERIVDVDRRRRRRTRAQGRQVQRRSASPAADYVDRRAGRRAPARDTPSSWSGRW